MPVVHSVWGRVGLALALLAAGAGASAQETYPHIDWGIDLDLRFRRIYRSEADGPAWNWFSESEASAALHLTPSLALRGTIHAEPGTEDLVKDNFFENTAIFLEQLYLEHDGGWYGVRGGKFNPRFGFAFLRTPGAFNKDFTEEYEIQEAVGVGGRLTYGSERWGSHELSAAGFFLDNSPLSMTVGQRRFENPEGQRKRRNRASYGGPGNTNTPRSYTVALSGSEAAALPGFSYTLGYSYLAAGEGTPKAQRGYVAGAEYEIVLETGVSLIPIAEYAWLQNDAGRPDIDSRYLTLGASLQWARWSLSPVYVQRHFTDRLFREVDDGEGGTTLLRIDPHDRYYAISIGYALDAGPELMLGWKNQRDAGADSQTVGLRLVYRIGEGHAH